MNPASFRNSTWQDVQSHLTEDLFRVHDAWREHGPCTTRQLAERSGISIFTLRPRTTDLFQIGLVECLGRSNDEREGVYSYVTPEKAGEAWTRGESDVQQTGSRKVRAAIDRQLNTLPIKDQVSIAAGIMARAGHAKKHQHTPGAMQSELTLA